MTSGIPRRTPSGPPIPRTAPIARIDLAALRLNLRAVLSAGATGIIDVRADAWGHGIARVAPLALEAGATALLVDGGDAAALGRSVPASSLVRAGAADAPDAVYGVSAGFTPVMSLRGRVLSIKPLLAGEGVSYGYTHHAAHDTEVALVTGGYAQGVVRSLGNSADVTIGGRRHPIVGRVAMDVCVVDVGSAPGAAAVVAGEAAMFFGGGDDEPRVTEWARASGLTPAELVTAVGQRAQREYVS
ncbi:MAG: alanine racemase C-terminal domain-containing protein [Microbacterium pygmaeum]